MSRIPTNPVNDDAIVARFSNPPLSQLSLSISNGTATEENSGQQNKLFTVQLSTNATQEVKVRYSTEPVTATAGSDYVHKEGTLTFLPGSRQRYITVPILGNIIGEENETFTINLSNPTGAVIEDGSALGIIQDNDGWWMNPEQPKDVDGNADVTPLDALVLINDLNASGSRTLPWIPRDATGHHYLDVNADGFVTPLDVLNVINFLNNPSAGTDGDDTTSGALAPQALLVDSNARKSAASGDDDLVVVVQGLAIRQEGNIAVLVAPATAGVGESSSASAVVQRPTGTQLLAPAAVDAGLATSDLHDEIDLDDLIELFASTGEEPA
jgi:hypothetical protein